MNILRSVLILSQPNTCLKSKLILFKPVYDFRPFLIKYIPFKEVQLKIDTKTKSLISSLTLISLLHGEKTILKRIENNHTESNA